MPVPPQDVQRRIADYLDTETARIDTLVAKNEHAADLVEERLSRRVEEQLAEATRSEEAGALRYAVRSVVQGWIRSAMATPWMV